MSSDVERARPASDEAPRQAPPLRGKATQDPVNRALLIAALVVVIVILGMIVYAVWAVMVPPSVPRTAVEQRIGLALEAIKQDPKVLGRWLDYVSALIESGQNEKAITAADQGVRSLENKAPLIALKARALHNLGRDTSALEVANEAIATAVAYRKKLTADLSQKGVNVPTPGSNALVDAHLLRAEILTSRKAYAQAVTEYTKALKEQPMMADVLVMRGDAYLATGDATAARADYKKALKYDPSNKDALAGLTKTGDATP
jgi:tetratricopeptide (TPR) repeat protein